MDSKFDLYCICRQDMSTDFVVDMKDIINHPDLQNKDIQIKLNWVFNGKEYLRNLSTGTIQLVGYFDIKEHKGNTTFDRCAKERCYGVCLYTTNLDYPTNLREEIRNVDSIVAGICSAIEFFNNVESKIN